MIVLPRDTSASFPATSRRGFTLLEIMVVLAIIGLLVGLSVANFQKIFGSSQVQTAEIFVRQSMKIPLTSYRISMGDFPTTAEGLQALVTAPSGKADRWRGPYLQDSKLPEDPWHHPYQYRCPGTHNKDSYDLFSFGPDGQESEDDIKNW